jgi:PTH1 family peptidyl-tRNA hydrolase
VKVICGLGNPGPEYEATRHNVGWWLLEHLAAAWGLAPFRRGERAHVASGAVGEHEVLLVKPTVYMNRSGTALLPLRGASEFDIARDLLVLVDDVALEPGHSRLRARGSAGGHNGLKSIEGALGTRDYPRLRIGVGAPPLGFDLVDWVLSPMPAQDEEKVLERFPLLVEGVRLWLDEGIEAAQRRLNG